MRNRLSKGNLFKGRHFEQEIIVLCVRWYLRYKLSYRDLVEMMAERGLSVSHTVLVQILDEGKQTELIGPSVQEVRTAAQISDGVCP